MKTLAVRPGVEVVEKTLRGPWPPELSHLDRLYKEHAVLFRALGALQTLSHSSTIAVGAVLKELGEEGEYLDLPFEFGVPLTENLNRKRHEKITEYITKGGYDVVGPLCISAFECVATQRIAEGRVRDLSITVDHNEFTSMAQTLVELSKKYSAVPVPVPPGGFPHIMIPLPKGVEKRDLMSNVYRIGARCQHMCFAGYFVGLLVDGSAYLCPLCLVPVGNIKEQSIRDIFRKSLLMQKMRNREFWGTCSTCKDRETCGGCRGKAFTRSGDPLNSDPDCLLYKEEDT